MRKWHRYISLLLAIVIISGGPLQVLAQENQIFHGEVSTEEERFDDNIYELFEKGKTSEIPLVLYEDEMEEDKEEDKESEEERVLKLIPVENEDETHKIWRSILRNKTYYSEISEEELILLQDADWTSLEVLETLEEFDMTLLESADYSFLTCVSDYTLDELLELFPTKESISQAYSCYELIGQYVKAGSITAEIASELYQRVESNITVQEMGEILTQEYNAVLPEASDENEVVEEDITRAVVEEKFTSELPDLRDYGSAPYSYDFSSQENVSTTTGGLTYQNNEVTLPGKNGYDLQINRSYNSDQAFEGIMDYRKSTYQVYDVYLIVSVRFEGESRSTNYYYYGYGTYDEGTFFIKARVNTRLVQLKCEFLDTYYVGEYAPYPDMVDAEEIVMSASILSKVSEPTGYATVLRSLPAKENVVQRKNYGLGYGWNFSFPSIESQKSENYDEEGRPYTEYNQILSTGNGGKYRFSSVSGKGFVDYKGKDIDWEQFDTSKTLEVTNGGEPVTYDRIVTHKTGDIWYFKIIRREGNEPIEFQLTAMQNKFGDTISFYYSENHDMRVPGHYINIKDTTGKIINIKRYDENKMMMHLPDGGSISYITNGDTLTNSLDQEGRETKYDTVRSSAGYHYTHEYYGDDGNDNPQYLLKAITHPTGLKTDYTYKQTYFGMGSEGSYRKYLLNRRSDTTNTVEGAASIVNDTIYTYSLSKNVKKSAYYIARTQVNRYGVLDIYSYSDKSLLVSQQKKYNNELTYNVTYAYDANEFLSKKTETIPLAKTDEWVYDNKGNILTAIVASNDVSLKNTTVVTYDSHYSIPLTKTWQMDASTKVQEEYTLSDDKKLVEWKTVYELTGSDFNNKVKKEAVQYIYDSEYRLIEQRDYLVSNGEITDEYRSSNFSYDGINPTRQWITGVLNQDGSLLKGDGIIENTFQYDINGRIIEAGDANGNTASTYYDAVGRVIREIKPDGTEVSKAYDDTHNTLITTDEAGFQKKYQFNSMGQIIEIYDLELDTWISRNYYNSKGLLHFQEQQSNSAGSDDAHLESIQGDTFGGNRKQTILYDWNNRPISDIYSSNDVILYAETYEYQDAVDQKYSLVKKSVGAANNQIITTAYMDLLGRVCKEGSGSAGTEFLNTYHYDLAGNKTKSTDARGNSYQYFYDYAGRVITEKNPDGNVKTYAYEGFGNLQSTTDYAGTETTYEYDKAGRLLLQSNPLEGDDRSHIIKLYDKNGNVITEKSQNNKLGDPESYSVVNYRYNNRNQVTDAISSELYMEDVWTRYEYDERGNQIVLYTGVGYVGELTMEEEDFAGDTNKTTKATYYEYDHSNRLTKMTDAMGQSELYHYDIHGNLVMRTDRNQQAIHYYYDALNRQAAEGVFEENGNNEGSVIEYGLNGLLASEDNGNHRMTYGYDNRGNVNKVMEYAGYHYAAISSEEWVTTERLYSYDGVSNRIGFSANEYVFTRYNDPDMGGVSSEKTYQLIDQNYVYDKMSRLVSVQDNLGTASGLSPDIAAYDYDSNSRIKNVYYPRKNGNLPLRTYGYNKAGLIKDISNYHAKSLDLASDPISSFAYTYQMDGNMIEKKMDKQGSMKYEYDLQGRLVTEYADGDDVTQYFYDRFGNRIGKNEILNAESNWTPYKYDDNNRLILSVSEIMTEENGETSEKREYQYDGNGNLVAELLYADGNPEAVTKGYKYDYKNRLIETDTHRYAYRADGYLWYKMELQDEGSFYGDIFYWDQGNMFAQKSEKRDGAWRIGDREVQTFIRGLGGEIILASDDMNNRQTDRYYYYDGHGDVVNTVDGSTEPSISDDQYDAYGNRKESLVVDEKNPFGYAGEYLDEDTGFIYLRNRFYSPEMGRFISEDTYWNTRNMIYGDNPDKDNPMPKTNAIRQSTNLYVYCMNNPLKYFDPTGYKAGDRFKSTDEATIDFAKEYYSTTEYIRMEQGSIIYGIWEKDSNGNTVIYYSYTKPIVANPHDTGSAYSESLKVMPKDGVWISTIHTHPNSEQFSSADKTNAKDSRHRSTFVLTPSGTIRKYADTRQGWKETVIATDVQFKSFTETQKNEIKKQYESQWNKHVKDGCNFNCKDKKWPND